MMYYAEQVNNFLNLRAKINESLSRSVKLKVE